MHQAAKTMRKARKKQKEYHYGRAKGNTVKVGDLVLYKNHHGTKLDKKWYACYKIVRKQGNLAFTIHHVGTGIEKIVHINNIQFAIRQTEWDIRSYMV